MLCSRILGVDFVRPGTSHIHVMESLIKSALHCVLAQFHRSWGDVSPRHGGPRVPQTRGTRPPNFGLRGMLMH